MTPRALAYTKILPDTCKASAFAQRALARFARHELTVVRTMTGNDSAYRSPDIASSGLHRLEHLLGLLAGIVSPRTGAARPAPAAAPTSARPREKVPTEHLVVEIQRKIPEACVASETLAGVRLLAKTWRAMLVSISTIIRVSRPICYSRLPLGAICRSFLTPP